MLLKGTSIILLADFLHLFSSYGGLRDERFSIWLHVLAPELFLTSTDAGCSVLFLVFVYIDLRRKIVAVSGFVKASFFTT